MRKTSRKWDDLKTTGKAFLENTSMHGLKYIAEDDRTVFERCMWVLVFGVGVGASFYLCFIMWITYNHSPSMIVVETIEHPLNEIAFPSVTICGQGKFSKNRLNLVMQNSKFNKSFTRDDVIFMMDAVLKFDLGFNHSEDLLRLHQLTVKQGITINELVNISLKTMITCDDLLLDCQWKNQPVPCDQLFTPRITDNGICCGFNHLDPVLSTNNKTNAKFPANKLHRAMMPGIRNGLTVILDANLKDSVPTTAKSNGFKMLINNAKEFPQVGEMGFALSPGFEFFAGLEAFSSHSSPEILHLSAELRGCYFDWEKTLQMHVNYSMSRCEMECLLTKMMEHCNCLPYIFNVNGAIRLCNLKDYICLKNVIDNFPAEDLDAQCSCLEMCNDFWLNCLLSQGIFPGEAFATSRTARRVMQRKVNVTPNQYEEYMSKNMAIVNVFYREPTGMLFREDLRYRTEDFVAAMGGALGLGFGFSFISVMEIVYFFAVRSYFQWRNRRVRVLSNKLGTVRCVDDYSYLTGRNFQRRSSRRKRF